MTTSPSPRSRRRTPAERSAEIGAASREVALEEGLAAITLRGLAARVGVASGLIAHYEPAMELLVARTFGELARAELAEVSVLVEEGSPGDRLRILLSTLLDPGRDAVSSLWSDAWSLGRRSPALASEARDLMDEWHGLAERLLREGVEAGEFTTQDPTLVALQLFALVDSTTAYALVDYRDAGDRTAVVSRSLESALGLLRGALDLPASASPEREG